MQKNNFASASPIYVSTDIHDAIIFVVIVFSKVLSSIVPYLQITTHVSMECVTTASQLRLHVLMGQRWKGR